MEPNPVVKGSLVTIILKLLEEQGRMYGYEMTKAVKEITSGKMNITEAALYPALHKLVDEKLLDTVSEKVEGRIRKYYFLTQKGKKESAAKISAMREALESVQIILNPKTAHG